jgi:hypothetical protein
VKKLYFAAIALLLTVICQAQNASVINEKAACAVPLSELTKADLSSKDKISEFIFQQIAKSDISISGNLGLWNSSSDFKLLENSAIIFIRHDYDVARLKPEQADLTALQKKINELTEKINEKLVISDDPLWIKARLNTLTDIEYATLIAKRDLFSTEDESVLKKIKYSKAASTTKASFVSLLNERVTRTNTAKEDEFAKALDLFKTQLAKTKDDFNAKNGAIIEGKDVIATILHKEDGEWSDYLLNTKKILVVILGGAEDIAKATIIVRNGKSELKTSLNELTDLTKKLGLIALGNNEPNIICNVFQINPAKVKPPSTIVIKQAVIKDSLAYKVHQSGYLSFKVGLSATYLEKNNFKIENQQLVVSLDENGKKKWKENLVVMLEGSFKPRDYDRFSSIFQNKENTPFVDRLGYFVGCKLSTTPWNLLTGGLSLSLTRTMSVNAGVSLLMTEATGSKTIGDITSLDEARKLADMQYSYPRFFLGISFSPRIITEALGLNKK